MGTEKKTSTPKRIGPSLYLRGKVIYARVRMDGVRTFRSTGTNDPATARKILKTWQQEMVLREHGIEPASHALERKKLTIDEVIDNYIEAGFPNRKMQRKEQSTIDTETKAFAKLRGYFGKKVAKSITLKDCDGYRNWRRSGGYTWVWANKTRKSRAGDRLVDIELQALGNALDFAVRREKLTTNPIVARSRYHSEKATRHCREVAPTPDELLKMEGDMRQTGHLVLLC